MHPSSSKRLMKNTIVMYFRMAITMIVGLYTSRVILLTLGVSDFGIFNVVGGVVVMFTFLQQALTTSTQRFLSYAIGKGNEDELISIHKASIRIYTIVCLVTIILAETIGLWFLNAEMEIPEGRMVAANYVYQFSILSTCVSMYTAAYNAHIIANERFTFYAYQGILEAVLKLVIVYLLCVFLLDRLIFYAFLTFLVTALIWFANYFYCRKYFQYFKVKAKFDSAMFKKLLNFSGWGVFGGIANMGFRQGVNVIINLFYGVTLNASFGIANRVSAMVYQFVGGFQAALNPQLTKSEAVGDKEQQKNLIYRSCKISTYLLMIVGIPVIVNADWLLELWLGDVPDYAVSFCQLMIIGAMVDAVSGPLWVSIFATGNIKYYQIVISTVLLLNLPFSYIFCKMGAAPENVLWVRIALYVVALLVRLVFMRKLIGFSIRGFCKNVITPLCVISVIVAPLGYVIYTEFVKLGTLLMTLPLFLLMLALITLVGFNQTERKAVGALLVKYLPFKKK